MGKFKLEHLNKVQELLSVGSGYDQIDIYLNHHYWKPNEDGEQRPAYRCGALSFNDANTLVEAINQAMEKGDQ